MISPGELLMPANHAGDQVSIFRARGSVPTKRTRDRGIATQSLRPGLLII
jgi:hypothetical protein